jgi:hypothetical protein
MMNEPVMDVGGASTIVVVVQRIVVTVVVVVVVTVEVDDVVDVMVDAVVVVLVEVLVVVVEHISPCVKFTNAESAEHPVSIALSVPTSILISATAP